MLIIYHNPRCAKSREGLEILEKSGKDFEIVKYLDDVPTKEELKSLIGYLGIAPIDLVRTNEAIWKENYKNGKSHGLQELYYETGQSHYTDTYENGNRVTD